MRDGKHIHNFSWKTRREGITQGVFGRIFLKQILKTAEIMGAEFIQLRTGSRGWQL
jgi:hypothetical protein